MINLEQALQYDGVYIYTFPSLIQSSKKIPVKIGYTSNNIKSRLVAQSTGQYEKPLVLIIFPKEIKDTEQFFHEIFKPWKATNSAGKEWFDLNKILLFRLVSSMSKKNNNYYYCNELLWQP